MPSGVDLTMPEPDDRTPFEVFFGGPAHFFAALRSPVWLPAEACSAASKRAEPALPAVVRRHATEVAQKRGIGASPTEGLRPLIAGPRSARVRGHGEPPPPVR